MLDSYTRIYINFNFLLGTMSQANLRENFQPPCPPRSKYLFNYQGPWVSKFFKKLLSNSINHQKMTIISELWALLQQKRRIVWLKTQLWCFWIWNTKLHLSLPKSAIKNDMNKLFLKIIQLTDNVLFSFLYTIHSFNIKSRIEPNNLRF